MPGQQQQVPTESVGSTEDNLWEQLQYSNNSMSIEERLIRLNSVALTLVWEGRREEALAVMRWSLQQAQANLNQEIMDRDLPKAILSSVDLTDAMEQGPMIPPNQPGGFHFYTHVFALEVQNEEDAGPSTAATTEETAKEWNVAGICALFLYNMSAVAHATALAEEGGPRALISARNLYSSALSFLLANMNQEDLPLPMSHLSMGIFNNLGHIASLWQDAATMQLCRTNLEAAFLQIIPGNGDSFWETALGVLQQQQAPQWLHFFLKSWVEASFPPLHTAAAA